MTVELVVPRRSLLGGLVVAAGAAVAGYAVARAVGPLGARGPTATANAYGPVNTSSSSSGSSAGPALARLDQIPAGGGVILTAQAVVLVREPGGTVKGFSAICTHQGCTVSSVQNGVISCPCHGSRFSALTGAVLRGPAPRALPRVAVVVRGDQVYRA